MALAVLALVTAVIAAIVYCLLRFHWTMRYPLRIVSYYGNTYAFRPGMIDAALRKRIGVGNISVFTREDYEAWERQQRYALQMQHYLSVSINRPENFVRISGV